MTSKITELCEILGIENAWPEMALWLSEIDNSKRVFERAAKMLQLYARFGDRGRAMWVLILMAKHILEQEKRLLPEPDDRA